MHMLCHFYQLVNLALQTLYRYLLSAYRAVVCALPLNHNDWLNRCFTVCSWTVIDEPSHKGSTVPVDYGVSLSGGTADFLLFYKCAVTL